MYASRPFTAWEAVYLWRLCGTDMEACPLLEDNGWTLPFVRLAPDDEPVYVGRSEILEGGMLLVAPTQELASIYDPATGVLLDVDPQPTEPELARHWLEVEVVEQAPSAPPQDLTVRIADGRGVRVDVHREWTFGTPAAVRDGRPVQDAVVHVDHLGVQPVTTDRRGRFTLPIWLDEDATVSIWAENSDAVSAVVDVGFDEPVQVELRPKTDPTVLRVRIQGGAEEPLRARALIDGTERCAVDGDIWVARAPDEVATVSCRIGGQGFLERVPAEDGELTLTFDTAAIEAQVEPGGMQRLVLEKPDGSLQGLAAT
ncbi:MAG: hypothetical protein GY913_27265 [Proteobacteria bacterium]|nr:hypothetical protein [Pseudomonadota bacterium]MCP4920615.1 hypothetical protein [Pseudomonadota bacterium]